MSAVCRARVPACCGGLYPVANLSRIFAVGAVVCTLAVVVPAAQAGTYVINNCPSAGNGNAGSWTVFGSPQNTKGTCSAGTGDYIGPRGGSMGPGALAGVQIAVPGGSGITIREAKIWWQVSHQISGADTFALASDNGGVVGESTTPLTGGNPDTFVLASTTTELTLANYCSNDDAGNGCTFGGGENNILELYGSRLTLEDNGLPSATVTGGALAGTGTYAGTQSLTFTGSDDASGVRAARLIIDGKTVAGNDYSAQCSYQNFLACPASVSDSLSWNTATASAGTHEIALEIESAAGDTTIVDDHTISIESPGPGSDQGAVLGSGTRWSVSLNVSPKTVRRHTTITLSGLVSTSPRPSQGKLVYLQARSVERVWKGKGHKRRRVVVYGKWISFEIFRARSNGVFSSRYRFKLGGRHTYQFRAVAPAEGQYRNPTGTSAVTTVHEI